MRRPRDRSRSAVPRSCGSPGSGDDLSPAWWPAWARREGSHGRQGTCPRCKGEAVTSPALPDYAPIPRSSLGPALNDQGYHVGRVERNLYWVTDAVYRSAFLDDDEGVSGGFMTTTSRTAAQRAPGAARLPPWDRAGGDRGRAADGGAGRHYRQHRPAPHPERAGLLDDRC